MADKETETAKPVIPGNKVTVTGAANTGKTSILKSLNNKSFVVSMDGKRFPFAIPHVHIDTMIHDEEASVATRFVGQVTDALIAYKEHYGQYPDTVVFDSISNILSHLANEILVKVEDGFTQYNMIGTESEVIMAYIEKTLIARGISVVLISHTLYNDKTGKYELIGGVGNFKNKGGIVSVTDESIYIEVTPTLHKVHLRSRIFNTARTLVEELPDSSPMSEYSLQDHLDKLKAKTSTTGSFEIKIK